jgi:hypothetical protein
LVQPDLLSSGGWSIGALEAGGESAAPSLLAKRGSSAEVARELAYRLYNVAERKRLRPRPRPTISSVQSWPEITPRHDRAGSGRASRPL